MIINKGDIIMSEGKLYISNDYINTDKEVWKAPMISYEYQFSTQIIDTRTITNVYTRKTYPEYYL